MADSIMSNRSKTSTYLRYLTVLGVVAFISLLFPNHTKFKYDYQIGRTWQYDDLIAPIDFPILKDDLKYNAEKDDISNKEPVVYEFSGIDLEKIKNSGLYSILELHMDSNVSLGDATKIAIDRALKNVYTNPILNNSSVKQHRQNKKYRLIKGNTSTVVGQQDVLNKNQAAVQIVNSIRFQNLNDKLGLINELASIIQPNYVFDKELDENFRNEATQKIPATLGVTRKGEVIINSGEIITEDTYRKLFSYEKVIGENVHSKNKFYVFGGYFLLTFLLLLALIMYIRKYFEEVFNKYKSLLFILIWPVIFSYLVFVIEEKTSLNTYMIPFAIAPIIIKNFFNERLALFVHIVVVLIASFLSHLGYEFTFLQIMVGIIIILFVSETRQFNQFYMAIILIFLAYGLGFFGLSLINEGGLSSIPWETFIWFFINALLVMLAYPFIPLLEKLFGFISSITLVELSDLNRPLLKDLLIKAPGTFQHSLQVGNLSEAAADKIGANSLLVKVGALYHDIGKMKYPEYFIENQKGENPHNKINYFESTEKIIGHVTEGEKMGIKAKLPKVIIDFITTHHGTTRTEYFFRKQKQDFPDQEFDETLFQYPGPRPKTKEQSILMIADSVEAASKSLKTPSGVDIDNLVDNIIAHKIKHNQLDESHLSFKELEEVINVFKSMLRSIYHVRIEYPKEQAEGSEQKDEA